MIAQLNKKWYHSHNLAKVLRPFACQYFFTIVVFCVRKEFAVQRRLNSIRWLSARLSIASEAKSSFCSLYMNTKHCIGLAESFLPFLPCFLWWWWLWMLCQRSHSFRNFVMQMFPMIALQSLLTSKFSATLSNSFVVKKIDSAGK